MITAIYVSGLVMSAGFFTWLCRSFHLKSRRERDEFTQRLEIFRAHLIDQPLWRDKDKL